MRPLRFAAAVADRVSRVVCTPSRRAWAPHGRLVLVRPLRPRAGLRERTLLERRTVVTRERLIERLVPVWRGERGSAAAARLPMATIERSRERALQVTHVNSSPVLAAHIQREATARQRAAATRRGRRATAVPHEPQPIRSRPDAQAPGPDALRMPGAPDPPAATQVVAFRRSRAVEPARRTGASLEPTARAPVAPTAAGPSETDAAASASSALGDPRYAARGERRTEERIDVERVADQVLQRLERIAIARRERMGVV